MPRLVVQTASSGQPRSPEHRLTTAPTTPWIRTRRASVPKAIRDANPGLKFRYVRIKDLSKLDNRLESNWTKPKIPKDFEGKIADKNRDATQLSSMYQRGDTVLIGITPEREHARLYHLQEVADRKRKMVVDEHANRIERAFGGKASAKLPDRVAKEIEAANKAED